MDVDATKMKVRLFASELLICDISWPVPVIELRLIDH